MEISLATIIGIVLYPCMLDSAANPCHRVFSKTSRNRLSNNIVLEVSKAVHLYNYLDMHAHDLPIKFWSLHNYSDKSLCDCYPQPQTLSFRNGGHTSSAVIKILSRKDCCMFTCPGPLLLF